MPGAVLPEHRPTLADVLRPAPPWVRRGLAAVAFVVLLGLAALVLRREDDGVDYVQRSPVAFNFRHPEELRSAPAQGDELVRLERTRSGRAGSLFLDSFAVSPLELRRARGDVAGLLPVQADRELAGLRRRFAGVELAKEGKARVNQVPGYELFFRARLDRRRLYGRLVLLPQPTEEVDPGGEEGEVQNARARRGVRLLMLATPASGVGKPEDVGVRGQLKQPFRSFRFGTEKP